MFSHVCNLTTFRKQYFWAAMVYFGLGVMLIGAMPDASVRAQSGGCDGETPCGSGETCCNGTCIPTSFVCCGDGTFGPSDSCTCCTGCTSPCEGTSTLQCQ